MPQTPFQKRAWAIAQRAHSSADRADARILMCMVEAIDEGDYASLRQFAVALRAGYRDQLGTIPTSPRDDGDGAAGAEVSG